MASQDPNTNLEVKKLKEFRDRAEKGNIDEALKNGDPRTRNKIKFEK